MTPAGDASAISVSALAQVKIRCAEQIDAYEQCVRKNGDRLDECVGVALALQECSTKAVAVSGDTAMQEVTAVQDATSTPSR